MRRSYNPTVADTRATDCLEATRRLYRGVTDIAKRLDEQKSCALTVTDVFTPSGEVLRAKLKDYCERLIFKDPVGHARKTEELLWRKAFYDAVSTVKKLRKGNVWSETDKALLSAHLAVGIGFYHHLILRLQFECDLDLSGVIDFAYPTCKTSLATEKSKTPKNKLLSEDARCCAVRIIHRSLVCLGDLARYKLELDPLWDSTIAVRYYKTAVSIDPNIGMPHNQLGTVAGNKNYGLDAVYHYTRCILCTESFEGAEGNLKRIITTHSYSGKEKTSFHKCVARLFTLLQMWNIDSPDLENINHECQDFLVELENCLSEDKVEIESSKSIENEESIEEYLQNNKNEQIPRLSNDVMFKIVAICLMTISKLQSKESSQVQGATAFILTILSQLMQLTITRLQEAVIEVSLPNGNEIIEGNSQFFDNYEIDTQEEFANGVIQDSVVLSSNKIAIDQNDNNNDKESTAAKKEISNGITRQHIIKKHREKSKNLLTKLRRPRKRLNSSDSEASDIDGRHIGSSSDEMNSDISETEEEDALSEGNAISDDAPSEDGTDDEESKTADRILNIISKDQFNGHDNVANSKENNDTKASDNLPNENGTQIENNEINGTKEEENNGILISGSSVIAATNGNSHDEKNDSTKTLDYVAQLKKQSLDPAALLQILEREESLQSIKICFDWLKGNPEIIRMFAKSSSASLKRVATLLNLVNVNNTETLISNWDSVLTSSPNKLKESTDIVPLPEDIDLRGLKLLEHSHKELDWRILRHAKMHKREETLLRSQKLLKFGNYISSIPESGIKFDEDTKMFVTSDIKDSGNVDIDFKKHNDGDSETEHSRGKLMRHMGRLWLKAEVRALETRLRSRLISPYLVPDQEALAKHTPALKRLVYAKKFIVIIPSVVVSALDEVKRTSSKAREATRWLEAQLRKGSRFLRAQRPHERLALPLIKGPRAKDKDAWLFFQIIECCHYLTQQTKVGLNGDKEPPVVTLLTGFSAEERKAAVYSPDGLAKSAGVNLEHIEAFHTKWKTSSKSHG